MSTTGGGVGGGGVGGGGEGGGGVGGGGGERHAAAAEAAHRAGAGDAAADAMLQLGGVTVDTTQQC